MVRIFLRRYRIPEAASTADTGPAEKGTIASVNAKAMHTAAIFFISFFILLLMKKSPFPKKIYTI